MLCYGVFFKKGCKTDAWGGSQCSSWVKPTLQVQLGSHKITHVYHGLLMDFTHNPPRLTFWRRGEGFFQGYQVNSHPWDTDSYPCAETHTACHQTGWEGSVQEQAPNSLKYMFLGIFFCIDSRGVQRKEVLSINLAYLWVIMTERCCA